MTKGRLEAFSDAVIAIVITIMVLELRPPHVDRFSALKELWPTAFSYCLSFFFLAIYWNNHHHMLQAAKRISGGVLWANMHLLFWLSLIPFVTAWMGDNSFSSSPVALYGFVLFMCGAAYFILAQTIMRADGADSKIAQAFGKDFKGKVSIAIYAVAIGLSFIVPMVSCILYIVVALIWLVPDKRIERIL